MNQDETTTLEKLADEVKKFRAFAQDVMACWPEGDVDGGHLEELAVKHGLLEETQQTHPCGESCFCRDYYASDEWAGGIICYRKTPLLLGAVEET